MIAKVSPAVRLPRTASGTYDYLIPENLALAIVPGSVIFVRFAGRVVPALVIETVETSSHAGKLSEVVGVVPGLNPVPSYVVPLWREIARRYAMPLHRLTWTALPAVPKRLAAFSNDKVQMPNTKLAPAPMSHAFQTISHAIRFISEGLEKDSAGQTLILVPTIEEALRIKSAIYNLKSEINLFHSKLSTGEKYRVTVSALRNTDQVLIGTKSSAFLPFSDLRRIIIVDAGSRSHMNEDQDPRFDARVVCELLAQATGARLHAIDPLPPLVMTPEGSLGVWQMSPIPTLQKPIIYNLDDAAKRARAKVLIAEPFVRCIEDALASGGRALLLLNRRGVASVLRCEDCGTFVECPSCAVALTPHGKDMTCFACERRFPAPNECSKCQSTRFKSVGTGSKAAAALLATLFPGVSISHIDRDEGKVDENARIVVGTAAVFRALPVGSKFEVVADLMLGAGTVSQPIFANEESGRMLRKLAGLVAPQGTFHIQTFDMHAPALVALTDLATFYANELAEREALGYPPKKTLVTLLGSGENEEVLEKEAYALKEKLPSFFSDAQILEPTWGNPKKFRGKYRMSLVFKLPHGERVENLVQLLGASWQVRVDY